MATLQNLDMPSRLGFIECMNFNINDILSQAQNIQGKIKEIQATMAGKTVYGEAGGGMVKVEMSGDLKVKSIKLDPICVDSRDIGMLEDLITAAVNQASGKAKELAAEEMKKATGGLPLPFDLF